MINSKVINIQKDFSAENFPVPSQKIKFIMESDLGLADKVIAISDLGIISKRAGKYRDAIYYYLQAAKLMPINGMNYYNMAKALFAEGYTEAAKKSYALAYMYKTNVRDFDLFKNCGHIYLREAPKYQKKYPQEILEYDNGLAGKVGYTAPIGLWSRNSLIMYTKKCAEIGKQKILELKNQYEGANI